MNKNYNRVCFAVGTGRCGTFFLHKIMSKEPRVASCHERNIFNECFHRYCQWHKLPIDDQAFLYQKRIEIFKDLESADFSFESSAPLTLSIPTLFNEFNCKFILILRTPEKVINSYISKQWYANKIHLKNYSLAPGFHSGHRNTHHFFSRISPLGNEFIEWNNMGQVGKLAWFWRVINLTAINMLNELPKQQWRVVRLEDMDYDKYCDIAEFIGYKPFVKKNIYEEIVKKKPNKRDNQTTVADWSQDDIEDFKKYIDKDLCSIFNYHIDIDQIKRNSDVSVVKELNRFEKVKIRIRRTIKAAKLAYNKEI